MSVKIARSEVSNLRMAAGNEKKYTRVIDQGIVKEWVGIGWVTLHKATKREIQTYPVLQDLK